MSKGGYRQINKALNICVFEDYLNIQQARLPKLQDVEQISPRVLRVLGQNPGKFTLQGTNTYIVGTGKKRLIIDTAQGLPEWAQLMKSTVQNNKTTLSQVFLTHWHGDHTGGVPDLIRMNPNLSKAIYKHSPEHGQKPIADVGVFKIEGATIRAVHTPGHSHDHMCFILEEERAMFTGDNILGHGTSAVENLSTWVSSFSKMQEMDCAIGYPAHGDVITDLHAKISGELDQKSRREERVVKALCKIKQEDQSAGRGKGSVTTKELVQAMHGINSGEMGGLALEPLTEEVLRKSAADGRAAFELRRGQRKWYAVDQAMVAPV